MPLPALPHINRPADLVAFPTQVRGVTRSLYRHLVVFGKLQ